MSYSATAQAPNSPSKTSDDPQICENNLQPFFVLHKACSKKSERTHQSSAPLNTRRVIDLYPAAERPMERDDRFDEKMRAEAFDQVWSKIEAAIKDVLRQMNTDLFNEIHRWAIESFNSIKSSLVFNLSNVRRPYPLETDKIFKQLSTALVLTRNIEFVDDLLTFEELSIHLRSHGFHVANLSSVDFNIKNGIGGCLISLLRVLKVASVDTADIATLAAWYGELNNFGTPIVVIIDDMERCNGAVFAEFIVLLSEWVVKLPIILVLGVATVDAPRKLLQSNVLQHLLTCSFTLGSPLERMDAIIEGVLIRSNFGFDIGYKVAILLQNYFLRHDGTVTSFIRALKIACAKHFAMEPLSILGNAIMDEDSEEFWDDNYRLLSEEMIKNAFDLPSCKRDKVVEKTADTLANGLLELKKLRKSWGVAVMCLYEVGKFQKMRLLDIFCEALDSASYDLRASNNLSGQGKNFSISSSSNDNMSNLESCSLRRDTFIAQVLHKIRDLPLASLVQLLEIWEKETKTMTEINHKVQELQSALKVDDDDENLNQKDFDAQGRTISRSQLNKVKSKSTLNEEVSMLAFCMVRDYLMPIECAPFHEIICFKNAEMLHSALIGDPRRTIQMNLLRSHTYLNCGCCRKSGKGLLPSMHDTSIMYNLAQEQGDLINLYDWYHSFKQTLSSNTKNKLKKQQSPACKRRKPTDEPAGLDEASIQARFCRAVMEIQITGLLRMPSKRRPDYVQRVAFGL